MAVTDCTCRETRTERYLDRNCPIHGDAEEHRRHLAAQKKGIHDRLSPKVGTGELLTRAEWIELLESLDDHGRRFAFEFICALQELDEDEKAALMADLDSDTYGTGEKLGAVQMHRAMAKLKRDDPEAYARTADTIGWEGRCHV